MILVAPDQELWERAEEAVREVLAYDSVVSSVGRSGFDLSQTEINDLKSRRDAKRDSLQTSVATAYRWVFYPAGQWTAESRAALSGHQRGKD